MGLFSFVKDAGKKIFGDDKPAAEAPAAGAAPSGGPTLADVRAQALRNQISQTGIAVENLSVRCEGSSAHVAGRVKSQEDKEKLILACGNVLGIGEVDEALEVDSPEPEATFYTVQRGDTLSKIAKEHYGAASKYPAIFQANRPMLEDPDKIYPGQVLRIPPLS